MNKIIMVTAASLAVLVSAEALAQSVTVTVAPDQRTRIKEYVTRERVAPVTTYKERVRVGSRIPADVELREVPADWGPSVSRYRYVYHDNRVQFVDPATREVIYDLD